MNAGQAKILVVDDVAENRELLVRRLNRLHITQIDQAANGLEALAALQAKQYDLVLLDIMMPELDGFGVLTALREKGSSNDMPVVVISAMNEIDAVVRCVELGAEDYLFKPFNPTLLRARVLASLEKKSLRDQTREELRRKQVELNEARTLQLALVPPSFKGMLRELPVAIEVLLEPAKEVGGDLVDHFRVGDDLLVVLLGDVSEKGAAAALMMARTHSLFRALAGRPDAQELFRQPAKAVGLVNAALAAGNSGCMFVTLLLGTLDLVSHRFSYVRAGHIPPFHRRGAAADDSIVRLARAGGVPLGLVEDFNYPEETVSLEPGNRLLIVTDGFTEASDPAGALYGEERIVQFMGGLEHGAAQPLHELLGRVRSFEAGLPPSDDMAAVLLSLGAAAQDPATQFEATLLAQPDAISKLTDRIIEHLAASGVDERATHHVALAIDELLTNVGTHGGCTDEPATIRISVTADAVNGEVIDTGREFDLRQGPEPVVTAAIEDRPVGELGLFLVRKFATHIDYVRRNGANKTTFEIARNQVR